MPRSRSFSRSFSGGEISPEMVGHIDDAQVMTGLARMRNCIAKPQGPTRPRPGFRLVNDVQTSNNDLQRSTYGQHPIKLLPFIYSTDQSFALAFSRATVDGRSIGNIRFHTQGATLLYTIPRYYVAPQTIDAIYRFDFAAPASFANSFRTTANHGLTTGDPVVITLDDSSGGAAPALPTTFPQITQATVYYAIVVDATHFQIAYTLAQALAFTPIVFTVVGSIGDVGDMRMHFAYQAGDLVSYQPIGTLINFYCMQQPWAGGNLAAHTDRPPTDTTYWYREPGAMSTVTFTLGTDRVNWAAHGQRNGSPISFSITAGVPVVVPGTLPTPLVSSTTYYVRNATTNDFQLSATPSGAIIDLGGAPVAPVTALSCGYYEVPHAYADADLFNLHYAQSIDVIGFTNENYLPRELKRFGGTQWTCSDILFGLVSVAPTNVVATPNRGTGIQSDNAPAQTPLQLHFVNTHNLAVGDEVFAYGYSAVALPDGDYVVNTIVGPNTVTLKTVRDGLNVNGGAGVYPLATNGNLQLVSPGADLTVSYVVTSVASDGTESIASAPGSSTNNLYVPGASNTVTWTGVAGAFRYNIYKKRTGSIYGWIGQVDASTTTFLDVGPLAPNLALTPPIYDAVAGGGMPRGIGYFQGRRIFAGYKDAPQRLVTTKSGTESDLTYSIPQKDNDRININVPLREAGTIRHVIGIGHLMLLTSSSEVRVTPLNSDALTPETISTRAQTFIGANNVQPIVVNGTIIFCANYGGHVWELGFEAQSAGTMVVTNDLSLRAVHLFDGFTLLDAGYQRSPYPTVWFVSNSTKLLGLTYLPEEKIGAWHQHDTGNGDVFESVCPVPEGNEGAVYAVIKRTVNGQTVRFVEVMSAIAFASRADAFFVDSGITYDGPATTVVYAPHLVGRTVSILADGVVQPQQVVGAAGLIILATPAAKVQYGLPYLPEAITLPLAMQVDNAFGRGRTKIINKVWLRYYNSAAFKVGQIPSLMVTANRKTTDLTSDQEEIVLQGNWNQDGALIIQQPDPLPFEIVSISMEVAIAD
jgi:hypothetical protein